MSVTRGRIHEFRRPPQKKDKFRFHHQRDRVCAESSRWRFQKQKPRTLFTKCGESSKYDSTYPGVGHRHLSQIPRVTDEDLAKILGPKAGIAAVGTDIKIKQRHLDEVKARVNPVYWGGQASGYVQTVLQPLRHHPRFGLDSWGRRSSIGGVGLRHQLRGPWPQRARLDVVRRYG